MRAFALIVFVAACGGSSKPAATTPTDGDDPAETPAADDLCGSFATLVKHAAAGFSDIQGEQTEGDDGYPVYASTISLPGSTCEISGYETGSSLICTMAGSYEEVRDALAKCDGGWTQVEDMERSEWAGDEPNVTAGVETAYDENGEPSGVQVFVSYDAGAPYEE